MTASGGRRIVVLGAGSAGLTAAVELARAGARVTVVERTDDTGGLAHTFTYEGCRLDYGPHAFHAKGDDADRVFSEFAPDGCCRIDMRARLRLEGAYFDYPLKFGAAMLKLRRSTTLRMIRDYLFAMIRRSFGNPPEESFEDWGVKRYGRTMYEMAFGGYSRKVWGMPTTELSARMAAQKLPDLDFFDLLRETLGGRGARQKILYSSYMYPRGGVGRVFAAMAEHLRAEGADLRFGSTATRIRHEGNRVVAVEIAGPGSAETLACDGLVSTIPIPSVVSALEPEPPAEVVEAANRLVYRNLVLVLLVVARPRVTEDLMVYLLDPEFSSNRIGEQKNLDPSMIPEDRTVLCFEFCVGEDGDWGKPDEHFVALAKRDLALLGEIDEAEITDVCLKRLPEAYPIYDLTFHEHLTLALDRLTGFENLVPLGRQGLFIHNDIHDSMMMGIEGARHLAAGADPEAWRERVRSLLEWRLS